MAAVAVPALQTARNDFTAKIAAAQSGGPADTAAKSNSRQALLGLLRQLVSYVQINCNNDMALLTRLRVSGREHESDPNSA